jgi:hypothetical protein
MEQRIAEAQPKLRAGYTLAISAIAHGSQQVEIRREGLLVWRAWGFEHGFESDFCPGAVDGDSLDAVPDGGLAV